MYPAPARYLGSPAVVCLEDKKNPRSLTHVGSYGPIPTCSAPPLATTRPRLRPQARLAGQPHHRASSGGPPATRMTTVGIDWSTKRRRGIEPCIRSPSTSASTANAAPPSTLAPPATAAPHFDLGSHRDRSSPLRPQRCSPSTTDLLPISAPMRGT
jgi:hypothetical protein